jgi:hypothetical protein
MRRPWPTGGCRAKKTKNFDFIAILSWTFSNDCYNNLRWIGHTLRKEDGEIPKAAFLWNPQGSRKRGRPKNSWRRSVIKETGRSWNELRFLAADRQKWKELVDELRS